MTDAQAANPLQHHGMTLPPSPRDGLHQAAITPRAARADSDDGLLVADPAAVASFDPRWLHDGTCMPLSLVDGVLRIAVAENVHAELLDAIRFSTGHLLETVTADSAKVAAASARLLERLAARARDRDEAAIGRDLRTEAETQPADTDAGVDDAPVVRYLHGILEEAIRDGVSDIHLEPYEHLYRVRFRRDGVLHEARKPPAAVRERLASRIKVLARLDIAERRKPQDGRMRIQSTNGEAVDMRVSTLPTLFGEKLVLRLMRNDNERLDVAQLGLEPEQIELLMAALARPDGMILVTGPTGSGKTMTLYTLLAHLNQPGANISSAEDPAEMHLPGINQVNINERTGLGFAAALRALLRQDPDTLMVGEIRDLETADIAIKAAQTGHRVLSTLHTRDAPGTLARLVSMGVAPFQLASAVRVITAQRLVRRLCLRCRCSDPATDRRLRAQRVPTALESLVSRASAQTATGCSACNGTGFRGRVGVHQVLPVSDQMNALILEHANARVLAAQARDEGVLTLYEAALIKVATGVTSLAEAESVCHV